MIRHHQGGVEMAADAAQRAVNRSVKEAALEMVKDQTDEIQLMMVMLDQRGGKVLPYPNRRARATRTGAVAIGSMRPTLRPQ